jgi:KR domain/Phosphopantetheine attachment site
VIVKQRWADSREVLRGKAHGAWLLHQLTRNDPLDFFILYSAAGVVLGAAGQGLYSAANAELDALAHYRRRLGLPALSVAWGLWAGVGMAADGGEQVWANRGLRAIRPDAGFAALDRLLADDAAYGAMIPIDWDRFLAQLPMGADRAFFDVVRPAAPKAKAAVRQEASATLLDGFRALPSGQRRQRLTADLRERTLLVLGLDRGMSIDAHAPLKDIGVDSLMAVELRNLLVRAAGQPLPATILFDYPSLDALAGYLMRAWKLVDEPEPGATPPAYDMKKEGLEELTDAEAEALLADELARGMTAGGRS